MKFERRSPDWSGLSGNALFDLFPYESVDSKTGLFWNRGSVGFVLKGHPLVGANLEDQGRIADFLQQEGYLPEGSSLQILLWACPLIGPLLHFWERHRPLDPYCHLAQRRTRFFENYATLGNHNGDRQILRDFRVYMSFSLPKSYVSAPEEGHILETRRNLVEALLSVGLFMEPMSGEAFVQDMREFLHPGDNLFPENFSFLEEEPLRRQIVHPDRRLRVCEQELVFEDAKDTDPWVWRGFVPRKWPDFWALGYMDRLCGDLLSSPNQLPSPFWIHYGLHILPNQGKEKALNIGRRESLEASLKGRFSKWVPDLEEEYAESKEAVEALQRGERVVLTQLCVGLLSRSSQLTVTEQAFRSLWTRLGFEFRPATFSHFPLFLSCMPMSWSWSAPSSKKSGYAHVLDRMGLAKKTLTREAQNLLPIVGEWKGQAAPGMLLYGRRGQLFFWNPFSTALLPHAQDAQTDHNYNVCIAGQSGSGKSVFMNELMTSTLGIGGKVFVLDFGRSFKKTCQLLGGQHIEFDVGAPLCLNPFTHIPDGEDAEQTDLRENLLSTLRPVVQVMASPNAGTTDLQNAFLEQAIRAVWLAHRRNATITHVHEWLSAHNEETARHLGHMLFSFTAKGNYGRFFDGRATAGFQSQLVVIETDQLRNHPDLLAVLIQMMILQINQAMALGDRKSPFLIMIDEAWKLLQGKDSAAFISQATRTARKYKGSIVLATQHLTDYFKPESPAATEAFNGSAWKAILYQEADVVESLGFHSQLRHFVENDFQKRLLKSIHSKPPHYSEVALFGPHIKGVIGRLKLDPFSRLLYSTNPAEYQRVETNLKKGLPLFEAIEQAMAP